MNNTGNTRPDFFRFERESAGDFPFYSGQPLTLGGKWIIVMLGCLLGYFALTANVPFYKTAIGGFLAAFLFFGIPLASLALVADQGWKTIFRKVSGRDLLVMLLVMLANVVVSVTVALLVRKFFHTNVNPVGGLLANASGSDLALFYLKTLPQLLGEEVVSILPFLAILSLCSGKLGMARKPAIIAAWIGTALVFGAIHLPTYGWNFVQCFVVIGVARVVLLLGYLITKNIWVSTGAHILNDWVLFSLIVALTGGAAAGAA